MENVWYILPLRKGNKRKEISQKPNILVFNFQRGCNELCLVSSDSVQNV